MRRRALVRVLAGALLLVLSLGLFAVPGVCAEPPEAPDPDLAERFEGKDWEDVISEFFDRWGIYEGDVAIGYYNTVTGEEHYINGDKYMHAASLYKVPLNMYYAEKVSSGEMSMDDLIYGISYEHIQTYSIQYSSNELSELLENNIGTYQEYKAAIAPYLCDDPEALTYPYYSMNYFTAAQFTYALKKLYAAPERYPNVLELMKLATPDKFFAMGEDRFVIAQKYGYYMDEGLGTLNDAAIIYTDEPIVLVLMSDFMSGGPYAMTDLCTRMCDYTQYGHQKRAREAYLAAQQAAEATPEPTVPPTPQPVPTAAPLARPEPTAAPEPQPAPGARWNVTAVAVMAGIFLLAVVLSLIFLKKTLRWLVPAAALLLFGAGLFLFGKIPPADSDSPPMATPAPTQTAAPTPAPVPTPTATPAPTPEPIREITLTGSGSEEVLALLDIDTLEYVDARASSEYAALLQLAEAKPDCVIDWTVDLGGIRVENSETSADLRGAAISAGALREKLGYLPALERVDICDLGFSNEESLSVIDAYPEIDFTWTVNFGRWAVRSDICVFSTLQGGTPGYRYTNEDLAPLFTYCTELAALDLGHNAITDLSPIGKLEKLQVLIIPDNEGLVDITPLSQLRELRYLELFLNRGIEDFSPLEQLTNMVDLNLSYSPNLKNADFLSKMPQLRMGWFKATGIPIDQWTALQETYPDAKLLFYYANSLSSTCADWRATDRNVAIRKAFANWANVLSFTAWDQVEYREGAKLVETYPSYEYE